jgi:peptide/nickel transport system ATP-binding protein
VTEAASADLPVLAVRDLTITFSGAQDGAGRVVDSVGFDLRAGRVLALVGESGSGKSLTAMSVLGLVPAAATVTGGIRLQGDELLGADAASAPCSRSR